MARHRQLVRRLGESNVVLLAFLHLFHNASIAHRCRELRARRPVAKYGVLRHRLLVGGSFPYCAEPKARSWDWGIVGGAQRATTLNRMKLQFADHDWIRHFSPMRNTGCCLTVLRPKRKSPLTFRRGLRFGCSHAICVVSESYGRAVASRLVYSQNTASGEARSLHYSMQ